jgi:hypothetical protein
MTDQPEPKEPRRIRRLTLADGLILIAAVAAVWRSDGSP